MSNAHVFRAYDFQQNRLLRATLPNSGVVEYDDFIQRTPTSGRVWRDGAVRVVGDRKER